MSNKKILQIAEPEYGETLFQTGKIWCETCLDWVDDMELTKDKKFLCCEGCGGGLVMLT